MRNMAFRFGPAVVLLVLTAIYMNTAQGYSAANRAMPMAVAWLTVAVLLIELLAQGNGRVGRRLRAVFSGSPDSNMPVVKPGIRPVREFAAFGWILAFFGMVLYLGFYIAIPVYVLSYLALYARKGLLVSAVVAGALVGLLYGAFKMLLGYDIFPGLLFGGYL